MNAVPAPEAMAEQPALSGALTEFLKRKPRLLVNGEWVEAHGKGRIAVIDPATERQIAEVADADGEDVDRAVRAARAAFESGPWADMLPEERERLMWRLADLMERHADELAELESLDNGKPVAMARMIDVPGSIAHLRYMAGWASKLERRDVQHLAACRPGDEVPHLHRARAGGRGRRRSSRGISR